MKEAISIIDVTNFKIIEANDAFLKEYGLKKEDVLGKKCYEITHQAKIPCNSPEEKCPLMETMKTGMSSICEHIHHGKNGEKIFVEIAASPIRDKTGKVTSIIHAARDITERKRFESILKEDEERFRSLVNYSPYGIAIHSERIIKYMNAAGANILGSSSPDQFIGKPVLDIIHPDYYDIARERIQMQEMGKIAPQMEEVFVKFDGTFVDVEITSIPITYNGKSAMYGVFSDITDRKLAEEKIRDSEEKFRLTVQSASDAIFITDIEHHIISLNKSAINMFGFKEKEVIGKSFHILLPERYKETYQYGLEWMLNQDDTGIPNKSIEMHGLRKDGVEIAIDLSAASWKTTIGNISSLNSARYY